MLSLPNYCKFQVSMSSNSNVAKNDKLRREDYLYVKHDKIFSQWKILIGPSDWEDYEQGKEGVDRYRLHNLPSAHCSGAGIYELGLILYPLPSKSKANRRPIRKIKRRKVVAVYLGKADNIRNRLQSYGRSGSHLEGNTNPSFSAQKLSQLSSKFGRNCSNNARIPQGPGLFTDAFSKGYAIVYRWASMPTKVQAEKCEAELLRVFDYAWNKDANIDRRPNDASMKIEKLKSQSFVQSLQNLVVQRKWIFFRKNVGIKIQGKKPQQQQQQQQQEDNDEPPQSQSCTCGAKLLTFGRSRGGCCVSEKLHGNTSGDHDNELFSKTRDRNPSLISAAAAAAAATKKEEKGIINVTLGKNKNKKICGAMKQDGTICKTSPLKNRKRCAKHKGRSVKMNSPKTSLPA